MFPNSPNLVTLILVSLLCIGKALIKKIWKNFDSSDTEI
jgi:hypothetical protein